MSESVTFRMTDVEMAALQGLQGLSEEAMAILTQAKPENNIVLLSSGQAEALEEALYDFVQTRGFDSNYALTSNGRLAEQIADRIFDAMERIRTRTR